MVTQDEIKRAVKVSNDLIRWALENYPEFHARGLPNVLATYVTAACIFRESGWRWYEAHGDDAFVIRTEFTEKYGSVIPFNRSRWLVMKLQGPVSFWAVKEDYIKYMAHARYYLPTADELETLLESVPVIKANAYLIVPGTGPVGEFLKKVGGGSVG